VTTLSYLELLGTLGHELRRPLTVVRGAATMLLSSPPDTSEAYRVQMLELIDRSAVAMSDLIEDLITVCHLEAGDLVLDAEQLEVSQIIDPVVEGARLQARQQPRPILVLGSNPGLVVHADAERAIQALRALVANAIAFSPPGSRVEISVRPEPSRVRFEVLDRGPGIPAAEREAIFQPFHRLDRGAGGAGLGLHLARGVVRAMGGDAGLKSRPGGGSIFWFTLSRRA
jgi:signal transduction histidine kinase